MDRMERWMKKRLYGKYISEINAADADKENSLLWLKKGHLFPETEGFIMAIAGICHKKRTKGDNSRHHNHCRRILAD